MIKSLRDVGPDIKLMLASRTQIRLLSPATDRHYDTLLADLDNAIALDFHFRLQRVFWTEVTRDAILSCSFNGSDVREVISTGLHTPGEC